MQKKRKGSKSVRLWMLSAGTIAAAAIMGLSLGHYVTRPATSATFNGSIAAQDDVIEPTAIDAQPLSPVTPEPSPAQVVCKGCGPTLAQRRWQADMSAYDVGLPDLKDAMDAPHDHAQAYRDGALPVIAPAIRDGSGPDGQDAPRMAPVRPVAVKPVDLTAKGADVSVGPR